MSDQPFTIPVVIDPNILLKLNEIQIAVQANYEAVGELKKLVITTGFVTGTDPTEVDPD